MQEQQNQQLQAMQQELVQTKAVAFDQITMANGALKMAREDLNKSAELISNLSQIVGVDPQEVFKDPNTLLQKVHELANPQEEEPQD